MVQCPYLQTNDELVIRKDMIKSYIYTFRVKLCNVSSSLDCLRPLGSNLKNKS